MSGLENPKGPPARWNRKEVIRHVVTGMSIEFTTIPLYLFAMYSVKPSDLPNGKLGTRVRAAIRRVVEQEMLHLALTGNILSALGSPRDLYDKSIIPQFPNQVPYEIGVGTTFHLERTNKAALECFMKLESPFTPSSVLSPNDEDFDYPTQRSVEDRVYRSIGMFYEDLEKGIRTLSDDDFNNNADKQFRSVDFFNDSMVVVEDKQTALKALEIIVEQGEGNVGVEDSHYSVFLDLYSKRELWDCYNVKRDVKTTDYVAGSFLRHLSLSFDAAYCYLLQTIQRVWNPEDTSDKIALRQLLLRNIHAIMLNILTPIADILVRQKFTEGVNTYDGAPCFNFYKPADGTSLYDGLQAEVERAVATAPTADKAAVKKIQTAIKKVPFSI